MQKHPKTTGQAGAPAKVPTGAQAGVQTGVPTGAQARMPKCP
jgi:hypothetical protein